MPKGYIIGHVAVRDAEAYKPYGARNDKIFPRYGGRFLARGGTSEVLEGSLPPRHVIVEFPSYGDALACYNSPEYQENMKTRLASSEGVVAVVEGA